MSQTQQISSTVNGNILRYSIAEIFKWNKQNVILPSMQRGFIWKAGQVEKLWDSLLRGFPVGSFLVTPTQQNTATNPLLLLDGQQRATAIRLATVNPWDSNKPNTAKLRRENQSDSQSDSQSKCPAVLWVDLDSSGLDATDDRKFVFRLITISHPWGYNRKNPEQTLTVRERRNAREKFIDNENSTDSFDVDWDLQRTWPWEAHTPVPFCLLWNAVQEKSDQGNATIKSTWECLRSKMADHDLFNKLVEHSGGFKAAFADAKEPPQGFESFYNGLKPLISGEYCIPAVTLRNETTPDDVTTNGQNKESEDSLPDYIQTLFLRTQRGGTTLEGEELHYSMLKAALPEICNVIEELPHKLARPSRLAILLARMTYALQQEDGSATPAFPPDPSLGQFRKWVKEPSFQKKFNDLIVTNRFSSILDAAKILLEQRPVCALPQEPLAFGLPPVLSAHLFRKSPQIMLVYLYWICKIGCEKARALPEEAVRKLIGFLTAISWFAIDEGECARRLWDELQKKDAGCLQNFWDNNRFQLLLPLLEKHNAHCMLPLPLPECVEQYFSRELFGTQDFHDKDSAVWKNWPQYSIDSNDVLKSFFATTLRYDHTNKPEKRRHIEAWEHFFKLLRTNKPMLLYAQRALLVKFFPNFDPSLPERIEDTSTPWDYDHIHASAYTYYISNISPLIRWWHGTIGNLRAWPATLNRSDSADAPSKKLGEDANATYSKDVICRYSAIKHIDQWESTVCEGCHKGYLGDTANHTQREALIRAIITRMVDIYAEWYTELRIDTLMQCKTDAQ